MHGGAGASGNDRDLVFGAKLHHRGDFFGASRKNHDVWQFLLQGVGVTFVNQQLIDVGNDAIGADDLAKTFNNFGSHRHDSD